jgi:hypothetical protein
MGSPRQQPTRGKPGEAAGTETRRPATLSGSLHKVHRPIRERSARTVDVRGPLHVVPENLDRVMQEGRPA